MFYDFHGELDRQFRDAVQKGLVTKLEWLLSAGADPNARSTLGMTMLHEAAMYNQKPAAIFLLENGADPTIKDEHWHSHGDTPDVTAEKKGNIELSGLLREARETREASNRQANPQSHDHATTIVRRRFNLGGTSENGSKAR